VIQELRRERHSVTRLIVHLVFVTKYRKKVFDDKAIAWLQMHFTKECLELDAILIAVDGESDHIHLLVEYPPKISVSDIVNKLKGTSSRFLRVERPDIARRYYNGVLWSPSYFAVSAGGAPLEVIKKYGEDQRNHY